MGAIDTGAAVVAGVVVLCAVGVALVIRSRRREHDDHWQSTMGTVISSTVQVSNNGVGRLERPLVLYAFQVGDRMFQGDTVCANGRSAPASKLVERYPAGSNVVVHYDPADPAHSALEL